MRIADSTAIAMACTTSARQKSSLFTAEILGAADQREQHDREGERCHRHGGAGRGKREGLHGMSIGTRAGSMRPGGAALPIPSTGGRLAQLVERLPYKQEVAGSSPASPTP